jgi:3-hydroxypropanoate dehydrogenase
VHVLLDKEPRLGVRFLVCDLGYESGDKMLDNNAQNTLFHNARTFNGWQDKKVEDKTLHALFDLLKMAPTSANCQPGRFYFIKSSESKQRLQPYLDAGNVAKTMSAPVTVIVGMDMEFYEKLPKYFPHADARSWFVGNESLIYNTAFRNSSLQGAYLIMAARSLGLDCGPMSGFNQSGVDKEFFADTGIKSNFLCNLGYGDASSLYPRSPRPDFSESCKIL